MSFNIILGDITKSTTTAIVNAANTSLLGGGGVDGAIHRAAGPELLAECRMLHGCKTGQAKITKGYRLKAKYVIHTPGPYYSDGKHREAELLESCYRSCLELALSHEIHDISFPSISTGIYRFPLAQAAAIAVRTIHEYPQLDVTMVCFDEKTKQAYEQAEAAYHCPVSIEYLNLPMKIAFRNQKLRTESEKLFSDSELPFQAERLWRSERTFRQYEVLGQGELPQELCNLIEELMEEQDRENPCPLTEMYPYLLNDSWELSMTQVSTMKVDVTYGNAWSFCVEKIAGHSKPLVESCRLCFYPYEDVMENNIPFETEEDGRCLRIYPKDKKQMLEMMKQILLFGTLDLREFSINIPFGNPFSPLTCFLSVFSQMKDFGTWKFDESGKGTPEDPVQMPFIIYPDAVMDFIRVIHEFADEYKACDLHNYRMILKEYGLENTSLNQVETGKMYANGILALLMAAVRGERFNEGLLNSLLCHGKIQEWLKRLQDFE